MSGDLVLADDRLGSVGRLLDTARKVFEVPGFGPAALVGGLAVTCRLQTVHRATVDVDTVTDGEAPFDYALEYLSDGTGTRRLKVDGVQIDAIATYALPERKSDLPDDPKDRLFVLGHRWALETAEPLTVEAVGSGGTVVAALNVATAPALLACKLHAIADRPRAGNDKTESDARDIYRLARGIAQDPDTSFADGPFDLRRLVADGVERWLIHQATRTTGLINRGAGPGDAAVSRHDLVAAGRLLLDQL